MAAAFGRSEMSTFRFDMSGTVVPIDHGGVHWLACPLGHEA